MRKVPYGFMLFTNDSVPTTVNQVRLAEELGFDSTWLLDSQLVGREMFVTLAACAASTDRIRIAPGVTHTATRHPSVIASGFASLAELAPGRTDLAIGYGDSAIRGLGGKPVRLEQYRQDFQLIRRLLDGEAAPYNDRPIKLAWANPELTRQIPMYSVPGNGPRSNVLAGELGHGVVVYCEEDELPRRFQSVSEGLAKLGKTLKDVPVIWWVKTSISDDWEAVKEHLAPRLASGIRHRYYDFKRGNRTEEEIGIPLDLARRVAEEYDFLEHATAEAKHGKILDEIPPAFWKQGILAGTPEEAAGTVRRVLDSYPEIDEVVLHFPVATRRISIESMLKDFATRAMPLLQ